MGSGKRSDYLPEEERGANFAQIPTSFGHELRACLRCRLVKTYDQFRESGCENCPFLEMDKEHDNVVNCTTPNFTGTGEWHLWSHSPLLSSRPSRGQLNTPPRVASSEPEIVHNGSPKNGYWQPDGY
ncbi:hypothetical protein KSP40_PGU008526 [Platanthera guangdongensis]|uniref:Spt4/RpoE2 zinc finger domain-containing protein n=1 Tax=Platanthera guangdongensis TaxID=2320717 RepID=A0ABR2LIH4_9ASPA